MASFSEIKEKVKKGEIKTYQRKFSPILAGKWEPTHSQEDFDRFFSQLISTSFFQKHPFYLSVPLNSAASASEEGESNGVIIGTQVMFDLQGGGFLEKVALKLLRNHLCRFVVVDATKQGNVLNFSTDQIRTLIQSCLNGGLTLLFIVGESYQESVDDKAEEVLKKQIVDYLKELTDQQLSHITLIYSPHWVFAQGLQMLEDNVKHSYHLIRHSLDEVLGEEKASQVRVALHLPPLRENLLKFVENSAYEGFYFPDLSLREDIFFSTLESIQNDLPELLESRNLVAKESGDFNP